MILNTPRIRLQRAVSYLAAMAASGPERLGREWADAIALDISEVDEILHNSNRSRDMARARSRRTPFG